MSTNFWEPLAWTLLHSFWQAGAVSALLWLVLRRMPAHRTEGRYVLAIAGLLAVVLGAVVTLAVLSLPLPDSGAAGGQADPAALPHANHQADTLLTDALIGKARTSGGKLTPRRSCAA